MGNWWKVFVGFWIGEGIVGRVICRLGSRLGMVAKGIRCMEDGIRGVLVGAVSCPLFLEGVLQERSGLLTY